MAERHGGTRQAFVGEQSYDGLAWSFSEVQSRRRAHFGTTQSCMRYTCSKLFGSLSFLPYQAKKQRGVLKGIQLPKFHIVLLVTAQDEVP